MIPVSEPSLAGAEAKYVADCIQTGWISSEGRYLTAFEQAWAKYCGAAFGVGVSNGTTALQIAVSALDLEPGSEIILPSFTIISCSLAIVEAGCVPVLVDVDPETWGLDLDQVEAKITPRTRAIMPIHIFGHPVDMVRLMKIAERHNIPVVEDACQGILSEFAGKRSGTYGIAAGFSLHPLKNLNVWGDAGVIVTNDDAMNERLRLIRNHGMKNRDEISILGCNSRLDSVQAVVGNWLVGHTHEITKRRIDNAAYYDQGFSKIKGLRVPERRANVRHVYHLYMLFAERRDALYQYCLDHGVEAKIHYPIPLYQQEGLKHLGYSAGRFPVTDRHAREVISFPVDQHLTRAQQDRVLDTVRKFYDGH